MLSDYQQVYKEAELRLYEFSLLVLVYEQNFEFLEIIYDNNFIDYTSAIKYLEFKGYIKQFGDKPTDITLRKSGESLFSKLTKQKRKTITQEEVDQWFSEWRDIFPNGSNAAGYRYKGSRLEGLRKMTKFVNQYDFTKEEIFKATKHYVNRFAIRGYNYMQQSHYFIDKKDSGSNLASECEAIREQGEQPVKKPNHGDRLI
jgi:hypothetical protein